MDAIADKMIYAYYRPEVKRQSLHAFQRSIKENVLRAKRSACNLLNASEYHIECQSEIISEFYDSASPYIAMWDDRANDVVKILYREKYTSSDVIECHCLKYDCSFESTLAVLRENNGYHQFRNNGRHFLKTLKDNCDYNPHHLLVIGTSTQVYTESVVTVFPDAKIFMIELDGENEAQLRKISSPFAKDSHFGFEIAELLGSDVPRLISGDIVHHNLGRISYIDSIMSSHGITGIDFMKIDVHGSEMEALRGAKITLEKVNVIQLEVYFNSTDYSFFELHTFLDASGFAFRDQGQVTRDRRGGLTSMTAFFARKTSLLWTEMCSLFPPREGYATAISGT